MVRGKKCGTLHDFACYIRSQVHTATFHQTLASFFWFEIENQRDTRINYDLPKGHLNLDSVKGIIKFSLLDMILKCDVLQTNLTSLCL